MERTNRPKILRRAVREAWHNQGAAAILALLLLLAIPCWIRHIISYAVTLLFITSVITRFVVKWRPRKRVSPDGKAVVITGCDSGFGHSLAQRLDDLGYHVFAGCLFPEGEGAKTLKKSASDRLKILKLDVTKDDDIKEAVKFVKENINESKLWAVVNNAGLNDGADLAWTNMDIIEKVIQVNTFGVVKVTKAFLPMICQSQGRVVAVASAAGRYTYPGLVPYCMSKQAVVSFCDGLRFEMYPFGVQVVTIEPWMYKTQIVENSAVVNYVTKAWESAPEEIKQMYPADYLYNYKKATLKLLNYSISHNVDEVVSCLEEAVAARNPRCSYNPGTLWSRFTFYVLQRLPKAIADLIIMETVVQLNADAP